MEANYRDYSRLRRDEAEAEPIADVRAMRLRDCDQQDEAMSSLFDEDKHAEALRRRDRSLSHRATKGALMIFLYREEPLFHQPFLILNELQKIDMQLVQWRLNHALVVQKQIGNKMGSGGSSGYHYLRATVSDRYKIFLDISNLAAFLVPDEVIPPLTRGFVEQLSAMDLDEPPVRNYMHHHHHRHDTVAVAAAAGGSATRPIGSPARPIGLARLVEDLGTTPPVGGVTLFGGR